MYLCVYIHAFMPAYISVCLPLCEQDVVCVPECVCVRVLVYVPVCLPQCVSVCMLLCVLECSRVALM
jgi:hypothetical protein